MNTTYLTQSRELAAVLISAFCVAICGCSSQEATRAIVPLKPVSGTIVFNGKPMAGIVVTFLPTVEGGSMTVGETDRHGTYRLSYVGMPGCAPGPYQVMLSYKTTPDGKPVTLEMQSALIMPQEAAQALERMPAKFSAGTTTLKAEVPANGGIIDFALEGELTKLPVTKDAETKPE